MEHLIFVDSREPQEVMQRVWDRKISHMVKALEVGDFQNEKGNAIIERKRPEDIWGRVLNKSNGWDDQMSRLSDYAYGHNCMPWLIVEGSFETASRRTHGKFHPEETRGAIVSAAVRYGIAVWNAESLDDLLTTVCSICEKADRELGQPKQLPFSRVAMDKRAAILMNICHVSAKQAEHLLHHFGSIRGVLLATENQLSIVDGVGFITAKKICQYKDSV